MKCSKVKSVSKYASRIYVLYTEYSPSISSRCFILDFLCNYQQHKAHLNLNHTKSCGQVKLKIKQLKLLPSSCWVLKALQPKAVVLSLEPGMSEGKRCVNSLIHVLFQH